MKTLHANFEDFESFTITLKQKVRNLIEFTVYFTCLAIATKTQHPEEGYEFLFLFFILANIILITMFAVSISTSSITLFDEFFTDISSIMFQTIPVDITKRSTYFKLLLLRVTSHIIILIPSHNKEWDVVFGMCVISFVLMISATVVNEIRYRKYKSLYKNNVRRPTFDEAIQAGKFNRN